MLAWLCSAIVGVVLALAGASKIMNWQGWLRSARSQHVWKVVAYALPVLELVLGALLIVMWTSAPVLGVSTLLLLVFTVYLGVQIAAKNTTPCACFGVASTRPSSWRDVWRNIALLALLFLSAAVQ